MKTDDKINIFDDLNKFIIHNKLNKNLITHLPQVYKNMHQNGVDGKEIKIAVIDSGIDLSHDEFSKSNIASIHNTIDMSPKAEDENGHGTFVTALICGKNVGIVPKAEMHIIKALNKDGDGTGKSILDAINVAKMLNVNIVCMSLGSQIKGNQMIEQSLLNASRDGIYIFCASGNDSKIGGIYPSSLPFITAVNGLKEDLSDLATFSNNERENYIDELAVNIFSAEINNKYAQRSGTSFATAIAVGKLALAMSQNINNGLMEKVLKNN